ncbi:MAG: O-antigen ligase family protein [Romboutsia sp.]
MSTEQVIKIDKIKYYLLMAFILIQPALDVYYLYTDKIVSKFGFSPATIIRVGITGVLVILTISTLKDKKSWILISAYVFIVVIYTGVHILNARDFYSLVPGDFGFSVKSEISYIIRMFIPITIIFITYKSCIKKKHFEVTAKWTLFLISGTIVITNLLKISLGSYNNITIKDNIIGWFTGAYEKYNYSALASKGIFNFANQISALLVFLLPVMIVIYVNKSTLANLVIIITTLLAMVMLGTKVALYGAVIDIAVFIGAIILISIIKRENLINKRICVMVGLSLLVLGVLISKAPSTNRERYSYNIRINNSKVVKKVEFKESIMDSKDSMIDYIESNYEDLMVNKHFITKSYPYKYDPEFWVEIINLPVFERLDWRNIEQKMLQRVMDINNNPKDKYLGLTFSRTQNIYNLERDFISQYYSMGIIGVLIFLGPYICIVLSCMVFILMKLKRRITIENTMICFATIFALGVSYYSGNVLDSLTVTIIMSFVLGNLINIVFKEGGYVC